MDKERKKKKAALFRNFERRRKREAIEKEEGERGRVIYSETKVALNERRRIRDDPVMW